MNWLILWLGLVNVGLMAMGPATANAAVVAADSLRRMTFAYQDAGYKQVFLAGTFTNWVRIPLVSDGGRWSISLAVPSGRQYYRFAIADSAETWEAIDPGSPSAVNHAEFGWVSVIASGTAHEVSDNDDSHVDGRRYNEYKMRVRRELRFGQPDIYDFSYQRVDGLLLGLALNQVGAADSFEPSARAGIGFGFSSGRASAGLVVLQPLLPHAFLGLKISLYDRTDYVDQTGISSQENTLAALLLHDDFRDYFRNKGIRSSLVFRPARWLRIEAGLLSEQHNSLSSASVWSIRKGDFEANPAVDEGNLHSLLGQVQLGGARNQFHLTYERSAPGLLGGSFAFEQITAAVRGHLKLGPRSGLDVRLKAGNNFSGRLPTQRRYLLGGLGTVRGYDYQSLLIPADSTGSLAAHGGERMILGNLEYSFELADCLGMSLFYDAGMAWADRSAPLGSAQLKTSAGLGFKPGNTDWFRIDMIQKLDDRDSKPVFQVRLGRAF